MSSHFSALSAEKCELDRGSLVLEGFQDVEPRRAAGGLARADGGPTERAHRLAGHIREVLEEAVAAGGSSLRDHRLADGSLGYFQHGFRVYDREGAPCPTPRCGGIVKRIAQSGRSTFFCGVCQR